jgi:hypothetical protein
MRKWIIKITLLFRQKHNFAWNTGSFFEKGTKRLTDESRRIDPLFMN